MTNVARLAAALKAEFIQHRNEMQIHRDAELMAICDQVAEALDAIGVTMPERKELGRRAPITEKRQQLPS